MNFSIYPLGNESVLGPSGELKHLAVCSLIYMNVLHRSHLESFSQLE